MYPRPETAGTAPRTWRELTTRPVVAPALRPQVDRALRLQRRDVVKVNAAAMLIATRMLRFYWALYDQLREARPNSKAMALAFSRA